MGSQLPIFELPLVLLPGERLPLHIFEERYKRMIRACLETGEPFGVLLRDSDGARSLGCMARVTEVIEQRYKDAIRMLEQIAKGTITLGVGLEPSPEVDGVKYCAPAKVFNAGALEGY